MKVIQIEVIPSETYNGSYSETQVVGLGDDGMLYRWNGTNWE